MLNLVFREIDCVDADNAVMSKKTGGVVGDCATAKTVRRWVITVPKSEQDFITAWSFYTQLQHLSYARKGMVLGWLAHPRVVPEHVLCALGASV